MKGTEAFSKKTFNINKSKESGWKRVFYGIFYGKNKSFTKGNLESYKTPKNGFEFKICD